MSSFELGFDPHALKAGIQKITGRIRQYVGLLFFVLLAALYGFVLLRINALGNAQPSQADVAGQTQSAGVPHVDDKVAKQLQSLEDNSVNVHTLFDQARNSPFQE